MSQPTPAEKVGRLLDQMAADRQQPDAMTCEECGEHAELICVDCEVPFCPEHLHSLGLHWAAVVCGRCMDAEMAAAS